MSILTSRGCDVAVPVSEEYLCGRSSGGVLKGIDDPSRWKDSLKWQRPEPYRKFAKMVESHWVGIASCCHPENKVSLGLVVTNGISPTTQMRVPVTLCAVQYPFVRAVFSEFLYRYHSHGRK